MYFVIARNRPNPLFLIMKAPTTLGLRASGFGFPFGGGGSGLKLLKPVGFRV